MNRTARVVRGVLVLTGLFVSMLWWVATPASSQPRRVVVVGDSIILGAQGPMVAGFQAQRWEATFDAAASRSTAEAVGALEAHRPLLTDSLVLSFGANDSGNPDAFRQRVDRLLDAAAGVPNVYWLTIREVRDYYGPANRILREAAAARPNVTVLDWHAATVGNSGATAGDGLHLSGSGAALMSVLVLDAVVNGAAMPAAPPPAASPVAIDPPPAAAPTSPAPPTAAPTAAPPATALPPTTRPPTTGAPTTGPPTTVTEDEGATVDETTRAAGVLDSADTIGATLGGGLALIVILLAAAGALLAAWSVLGARSAPPTRVPAANHPAVRSRLRAARIAAASTDAAEDVAAPSAHRSGQSEVTGTQ